MNDEMFTNYFEDLEFDVAGYRVTLDILGVEEGYIDYKITDVQIIDKAVKSYPYRTSEYFHYMTELDDYVQEHLHSMCEEVKEYFD